MVRAEKGAIGCGCLLFLLVVGMVLAGVLIHPFSLKVMAGRFHYADKIVPCDAILVPRFVEDRNGEVYLEAFREYWVGNGKTIWIEDDRVFGFALKDIIGRMAKEKGVKEGAIRALEVQGDDIERAAQLKDALQRQGVKRVVLVAPAYASRRFHLLYGPKGTAQPKGILFLIKPVDVSYFKPDKWWRSDLSRTIMGREIYRTVLFYVYRFKYGGGEERSGSGP